MSGLFILLALAVGLALIGDTDTAAPEEPDQPDPSEPPSSQPGDGQPNLLSWGDATVTGTQGDDILPAGDTGNTIEVDLLGGNDQVEHISQASILLRGGEGNDTLSSTAEGSQLNGGAGDDVLTGATTSVLSGGAGNDILTYAQSASLSSSDGAVSGGDGDDIININVEAHPWNTDATGYFSGVAVNSGSGADTINLTISLDDQNYDSLNPFYNGTRLLAGVRLTDFDPANDTLNITLSNAEASQVGELTRSEITTDFLGRRVLELQFAATGSNPAFTSSVILGTNPNITMDQINLIDSRASGGVAATATGV